MKQEADFELLPIPEVQQQKEQRHVSRMSLSLNLELLEKVKDYAYEKGFTQQQVVTEAVELLLKDKKIKSRPEAAKNRPRPGRKPKHQTT